MIDVRHYHQDLKVELEKVQDSGNITKSSVLTIFVLKVKSGCEVLKQPLHRGKTLGFLLILTFLNLFFDGCLSVNHSKAFLTPGT